MKIANQSGKYTFFQKNLPVVPKLEKIFNNWLGFMLRPKFSKLSRGPVVFPGGFGTFPAAAAGAPDLISPIS